MSLGRDPLKSMLVLDDPSVDPLHARVQREGDNYRILDEGSIAGTWVNYTPVSKEGTLLEHGDLVHIGRMGFRFMLQEPTRKPKPIILPQEPPK
jgi:pSer/pThr/pTyr-binding forkhead associated (FHA) protein